MKKTFMAILMTITGASAHATNYQKYVCKDVASG